MKTGVLVTVLYPAKASAYNFAAGCYNHKSVRVCFMNKALQLNSLKAAADSMHCGFAVAGICAFDI